MSKSVLRCSLLSADFGFVNVRTPLKYRHDFLLQDIRLDQFVQPMTF